MANLRVDKITSTETFETTGSVQFDGVDDGLTISDNAAFDLGTGDFTIEGWYYLVNAGTYQSLMDWRGSGADGNYPALLRNNTGNYIYYYVNSAQRISNVEISYDTWFHVSICRFSGITKLFIDGKEKGSFADTISYVSRDILLGVSQSNSNDLKGHISNYRVVKGRALYTSNFKTPMRELEVVPGTVLLACQSKTDATLEKTGKTITANGNAVACELTPGLLTPIVKSGGGSAITGSVEFGENDYLTLTPSTDFNFGTGDFTIEFWIHPQKRFTSYPTIFEINDSDNAKKLYINFRNGANLALTDATTVFAQNGLFNLDDWFHVAVVRTSGQSRLYMNGVGGSSVSCTRDFGGSNNGIVYIGWDHTGGSTEKYNGFISNLRVVKGTALYTADFIPPTRELKRVPGTVLLCCQDENSITTEAIGKTITGYGDPAPSNFTPQVGDDRKVTFEGVTKINTDAYFYLPTGDTASREATGTYNAGTRGLFGGGNTPTKVDTIEYITIASTGDGTDFGDLTNTPAQAGGAASNTRGIIGGGYDGSARTNVINYLTVPSIGNALNFGDLTVGRSGLGACSSSTRAIFSGGTTASDHLNTIDYVTIASTGNAQDFGDLLTVNNEMTGCASPTRGIFGSGDNPSLTNTLQYVTIATSGNSQDFGDLTIAADYCTGFSNSIRGIFYIGYTPNPASNIINYVTISSTGNAVDFGDAFSKTGARSTTGASSSTRGVVAGGDSPAKSNIIEYVTIATTGNGQEFGALTNFDTASAFGLSNGHGGLG